jgi:hypothetical protein
MDVNTLRVAVTVASLVLFAVLVIHTWSRRRGAEHADAARLALVGEEPAAPSTSTAEATR